MPRKSSKVSSATVKKEARKLGADLCGVAAVERFSGAPTGFHPRDVFPKCESVIVLGFRLPPALLDIPTPIPYTMVNYSVTVPQLDHIAVKLCNWLYDHGVNAIPIPTDSPYEYWEAERKHGRGIISLKHAAVLAGLGEMGKNTLLITKEFGNMVTLGAVLADAKLEPDSLLNEKLCLAGCRKCLDACPVGALDGTTAEQKKCREHAYFTNARGFDIARCSACRKVCPGRKGAKK